MRTRIKEFRARYDMTQAELAHKVGVRRETIVFLEKGKYNPSLKLAHDVAVALNSTIEELFLWDDDDHGSIQSSQSVPHSSHFNRNPANCASQLGHTPFFRLSRSIRINWSR